MHIEHTSYHTQLSLLKAGSVKSHMVKCAKYGVDNRVSLVLNFNAMGPWFSIPYLACSKSAVAHHSFPHLCNGSTLSHRMCLLLKYIRAFHE